MTPKTTIATPSSAALFQVFCLVVFHYGLKLQLPLFQWV